MCNGWKVPGLSLIRVKQNQCSFEVGRILPNHQIFCIQLYGKTLERVAKFSYLGVVLGENLSWKDQVEYVSSEVSQEARAFVSYTICLTLEASRQGIHFTLAAII